MWNILIQQAWNQYRNLLYNHTKYEPQRIIPILIRMRNRALRREKKAIDGWMRYTNGNMVIINKCGR